MAFDKWTLLCSILFLYVSSTCRINAQSCGGLYTETYGVFMSPNYPDVYNISIQCSYTISLTTISQITLSFETFELDRSMNDYVVITCESYSNQVERKYFWNSNIPPILIPVCSSGQLYFNSDSYHNFTTRGFKVQYQVSTRGCGDTVFTASAGAISSPNYPQNYSNDEDCTYSIWASSSSSFMLSFKTFNLEEDLSCNFDWIQIWCDNSSYISPKYCGSTLPKPARITNCNKVLIWFHTDIGVVHSGFRLQYSVTPDGCGKSSYAGLSGIITSPNYPKTYNNMSCDYYLYPVSSIALAFQSFDLEPFIDSTYGDYVWIHCNSNTNYSTHYFRGNTLPQLISYQLCSHVHIHLYANDAISGTGFNVKYQVNQLVAHSAITTAPKNFTVVVGSQVILNCTSDATDYYPSWTLSTDGSDENTAVIASFCVVNSDYTSQYYVVSDGPGVCNLVITSATQAEAGIYTCIDVGLASSSSVLTVMVSGPDTTTKSSDTTTKSSDQGQNDSDVIVIVLSVLLAILALGYIGIAIFFVVRRCRESSKEKGQRNPNQDMRAANNSVKTLATGFVYEDIPAPTLSTESYTTVTRNDDCGYEHLNNGFDNPAAYDTLKSQSSLH